jgi:hypothetical protein
VSGRYRRIEPVVSLALPDLGQLLVMTRDAPKTRWLNATAWLVYSLCDGRDVPAIEAAYRERLSAAHASAGDAVTVDVRRGLRHLAGAGLITG